MKEEKFKESDTRFGIIQPSLYEPIKFDCYYSEGEYRKYGIDDKYPEQINEIYNKCSTLKAIIKKSAMFTYGNGINLITPESFKRKNVTGDTIEKVIKRLILDYWIYGGFAFQVQYNRQHRLQEIIYLDFRYVRTDRYGNKVYYFDEGKRQTKLVYPAYNADKLDEFSQIYYCKGDGIVYPEPLYSSTLKAIATDIKIQDYQYNLVNNNFMPTGILNFNGYDPEQADKDKIKSNALDVLCGSENAGGILFSFNPSPSNDNLQGLTYDAISNTENGERYMELQEATNQKIFSAFGAMPQLFGINVSTGFNEQEYLEAFKLYSKEVTSAQNVIIDAIDEVFGKGSLTFESYTL